MAAMKSMSRGIVTRKAGKRNWTNYSISNARLRGLNPKPILEIIQLSKVFEQYSNKEAELQIIQRWYIKYIGKVTNWEKQYHNS